MQLMFNAIAEPTRPGPKWQKLFNTYWAAYRAWYASKGVAYTPSLGVSQAALKRHMPEMWPTYERLCELAGNSEVAARFLTGYQPPAYISGCSQAVLSLGTVQLVRNYDYHPDLIEGTQILTAWNGKKVIGSSDCLIGLLDGMNEDGLAISLTFGGRRLVGEGFGIPFILRYVLEFCSTVEEAVETLTRVPSHMSYNVTVIDRSGDFKTVQLAPDKSPLITNATMATNHQGVIDWHENAHFNKTVERAVFLENLLEDDCPDETAAIAAFLQPPLYNTRFREGFGTLYTAVYHPMEGSVQMHWPTDDWLQTFDNFQEGERLIKFSQHVPADQSDVRTDMPTAVTDESYQPETALLDWQETVAESLVDSIAEPNSPKSKKLLKNLRTKIKRQGQIPWEIVSDFWSDLNKKYSQKWRK